MRRRFVELGEALDRAADLRPGEREEVRDAIVALFREADQAVAELTEFRESIRALVDRYRETFPARRATAASAAPAVRVDHLGSSTYVERAWSAIAAGDHEAAAREARRALDLAPGDARATTLLGWAQAGIGELEEARATLGAVLASEPGHALARACLGYAALRQGRPAEAIELLEPVTAEGGDRKAALYARHYLGMAYAARQMHAQARAAFADALALGPNLVEAYWETGRSFYTEGDLQHAAEAWRRGAEANRFNPWAERCRHAVECLKAGEPVPLD